MQQVAVKNSYLYLIFSIFLLAGSFSSADEIKKVVKKILKKEKDKAMPIKSLRKAFYAKYCLEKKGKKHMKKLLKENHYTMKRFGANTLAMREPKDNFNRFFS